MNNFHVHTIIGESLHPNLHTLCGTIDHSFLIEYYFDLTALPHLLQRTFGGLGPGLTSMSCERANSNLVK